MRSARLVRAVYGAGERHDRHAHEYASVSVVLHGALIERVGGTEESVGPLAVVVKPAGTEHADVFGPRGATLLRLELDREWMSGQTADRDFIGGWRWCEAPATGRWLLRLAALDTDRVTTIDDAVSECLGALRHVEQATGNNSSDAPLWLRRVRDRIRDARGCGVTVRELADEAGVHPVYLTSRFRRAFGCSVVGFRTSERVRAAATLIAAGTDSLAGTAADAGFADQAHLTRSFRRIAGVTPAVYRRLVRQV
jgi:AraC family transcriptional regulator